MKAFAGFICFVAALTFATAGLVAQAQATKDAAQKTGSAVAGAAKTTTKAAGSAAKATGEATADAAKATAKTAEKGAKKAGDATADAAKATGKTTAKGAEATADGAKKVGSGIAGAVTGKK